MSHVYRARDTVIDRPVVVKLLTDEACRDPEAKARFLQEARLAGNIQHENIVSVFDFGEHDGRPFIVMEYLKGEDLRDAIRGGRTGSLMERMKIALQIAEALEYVHGRGIVHRDIKPENIHIDPNGRVKLMDFGIAKTADLSLTRTGMTMGTPYYMAPEQVAGRAGDAAGRYLRVRHAVLRTADRRARRERRHHRSGALSDPECAAGSRADGERGRSAASVRALVLRCVEKKPEDRPQSFREVVEELRGLIAGATAEKTQPVASNDSASVALRRRRRTGRIAGDLGRARGGAGRLSARVRRWWATRREVRPSAASARDGSRRPPPAIPGMIYIPAGTFFVGSRRTRRSRCRRSTSTRPKSRTPTSRNTAAPPGAPRPTGAPDLPVVRVTVAQAREYAAWKGKRLPTALEWERAARGTDGNKYPWGNEEDASLANIDGTALKPVKSYAAYPRISDGRQRVGNGGGRNHSQRRGRRRISRSC